MSRLTLFIVSFLFAFLSGTLSQEFLPDYLAYETLYNLGFDSSPPLYKALGLYFDFIKTLNLGYSSARFGLTFLISSILFRRASRKRDLLFNLFLSVFIYEFGMIRLRAGLLFALILIMPRLYRLSYAIHPGTGLFYELIRHYFVSNYRIVRVIFLTLIVCLLWQANLFRIDFKSELNTFRYIACFGLPSVLVFHKKNITNRLGLLLSFISIFYVQGILFDAGELLVRWYGVLLFFLIFVSESRHRWIDILLYVNSLFFLNTIFKFI